MSNVTEKITDSISYDLLDLSIAEWILAILLSFITIATVLGNLLVMVAIYKTSSLRSTQYIFIFCLALCDFTLGLVVLPFATYSQVYGNWPFGILWCNIWTSMDCMLCSASVLHLLLITLDRKLAIRWTFTYHEMVTKPRIALALMIVWFISIGNSFIPIFLGLNTADGKIQNTADPNKCVYDSSNTWYALIVGLITFIIPLVIMLVMYIDILQIARLQSRQIRKQTLPYQQTPIVLQLNQENKRREFQCLKNLRKTIGAVARQNKATCTVFIIFGIFTLCWFPYMVIYTFSPLWGGIETINFYAFSIFLWTGYANSTINPVLYTLLNRQFRNALKRLFGMRNIRENASFLDKPSNATRRFSSRV